MRHATREVVSAIAKINPETFDLYPEATGKTGQAAVIADGKFAFQQVIVAQTKAETLVFSEQKLSVKDHVAKKIIDRCGRFAFRGLLVSKKQHFIALQIWIIVPDIPLMQVVGDDAEAERQVLKPFAYP